MDKYSSAHNDPMIFTLSDEADAAGWERNLYALRRRREEQAQHDIPQQTVQPQPVAAETAEWKRFGDEELDAAYREYLHRAAAEHNAAIGPVDDVGLIIEEDFLQAQQALQSEYGRRRAEPLRTVWLNRQGGLQPLDTASLEEAVRTAEVPPAVLHVYALPEVSGRRLQVISEQELLEGIRAKLKPHLSNALSGMVQRAIQKKLATISYDIQMILNEETAKLVDDLLEYNLEAVMRNVKSRLRQD